jgi:hypothetical protein
MTSTPVSLLERPRQPFEPEAWARFVALYTPLMREDFEPATWRACWEVVVAERPAAVGIRVLTDSAAG